MEISSRTTEGAPNECPICGKQVWIAPSVPPGDATCPHCGSLIWFSDASISAIDVLDELKTRGATVRVDNDGQVRAIRLTGPKYTDSAITQLAKLKDIEVI